MLKMLRYLLAREWKSRGEEKGVTNRLALLKFVENVEVRSDTFGRRDSRWPQNDVHDSLEQAVVDVARYMGMLEQALVDEDIITLRAAALALLDCGRAFGFEVMSRVAEDLIGCVDRRSVPALQAVGERLIRVGDASLAAAIEQALP